MGTEEVSFEELDDLFVENESEADAILAGLDTLDKKEEEAEDAQAEVAEKNPSKEEKPEYRKEELLAIFDTILFEQEYRETFKIGDRYHITLRTRTGGESNEITRKVDALDLKTFLAVQNFSNVITLAYSLVNINGRDLSDTSIADRYKIIKRIPEGLLMRVSQKMFEFDKKVFAAMEEGDKNF